EMIVWGGTQGNGVYLNTGGRYNPGTDNWTAASTTNVPIARAEHTAVWIGSEMIVWGGYDGTSSLNTGGRYNPISDSWTATGITNAPAGRYFHTAVWTGHEMIIWGGRAGAGMYFSTGGRYDPSIDGWTATSVSNAPSGRYWHTAVWTGSQMIVWGGVNSGGFLNGGSRYCAVGPSATPTPTPPCTGDTWTATNTTNPPAA